MDVIYCIFVIVEVLLGYILYNYLRYSCGYFRTILLVYNYLKIIKTKLFKIESFNFHFNQNEGVIITHYSRYCITGYFYIN